MTRVEMEPLKRFAMERAGVTSPLGAILASEPDVLDAEVFLARVRVWLRLADLDAVEPRGGARART